MEEIKAVAREELQAANPMTLRQVHYRLVARADTTYTNTQGDYNQLSKWLVQERLSGAIPWEWIEDRLRKPRHVNMFGDLEEFVEIVRHSYRRDVWTGQPDYLEVFVEKDALSAIFEDALGSYGVTLNVGRGYSSWSSIKAAADRFDGGGTILYFGDFDPSGEDMVRALEASLANPDLPNGGSFPTVIKCALTPEDIDAYSLPAGLHESGRHPSGRVRGPLRGRGRGARRAARGRAPGADRPRGRDQDGRRRARRDPPTRAGRPGEA